MAVPTEDKPTILLSLSRMNHILDINAARGTVTVEAGCIMEILQEAVAAQGLVFAPDWGARGTATVGGAVATNGGGLNVLRFGTTREQVLGVEVVLADGRIWNGQRALIKDNSGYDLKQLFIGPEGTLGIITKLTFRLHPAQPYVRSMFASLCDASRLMEFLTMARSLGGEKLTAFELLPAREGARAVPCPETVVRNPVGLVFAYPHVGPPRRWRDTDSPFRSRVRDRHHL
ncbi:FAD-binding oxidoreductase [Sulfitobacter pontiacus]